MPSPASPRAEPARRATLPTQSPTCVGKGRGAPVPDNDDLTNIRNVLGFLLAGFGALLSFLGIRSSEISTVLRNDSQRASIIAFILLLGVLAAVSAIVTKSRKRVNTVSAVAIGLVLFGVGALVIFYIPVGSDSESISKWIGAGLVAAGAIALLISLISGRFWAKYGRYGRGWETTEVLIFTSVMLMAIAAYGAMRLESKSQLSFSSQVGARISVAGPIATVSTDITATKLPADDWVFVDIYAVPATIKPDLESICANTVVPSLTAHLKPGQKRARTPGLITHCMTDPCLYLNGLHNSTWPDVCDVLLSGSIVPNATGDVDKTLSTPFVIAKYQDVDIRAEVCSGTTSVVCRGSRSGQNSRLDWVISNSQITPANLRF
jgi:hypothetical protein